LTALKLEKVNKSYGKRPGVRDLSLTIAEGEMFGFLGPNGAGKTTTIRLLLGLLKPESGSVRLFDEKVASGAKVLNRVGFLPDIARIDGGFGGQEWLEYLAALHQNQPDHAYREILCDRLELARADRDRKIKTYSRGMRQKLAIVQCLQHRPDLIIMDEPTEGLDPLAKRALFDLLREVQQGGATVFFSSHVLSEVERLCDRVALIRRGELVAVDSIAALRDRQTRRVEIAYAVPEPPEIERVLRALVAAEGGNLSREGERWKISWRGDLNRLLKGLAPEGANIRDLVIEPADLEDIFLSYYSVR
jgi:ABC-2 type transport system ATP-binding protein